MTGSNKYTKRIAGHFVDQERFIQAIYESTEPFFDIKTRAEKLPLDFDLDSAIGVQLDAVGVRVGIGRRLKAHISGVYFEFDNDGVGYDQGVWKKNYDPNDGVVELDDDFYRILIRAKIALNSWDGKNESLKGILEIIFNDENGIYASVDDRQDMSMIVGLSGKIPSPLLMQLLIKKYINVKPAGVGIAYYITPSISGNLFAFDVENEYFAGFDKGVWGLLHAN